MRPDEEDQPTADAREGSGCDERGAVCGSTRCCLRRRREEYLIDDVDDSVGARHIGLRDVRALIRAPATNLEPPGAVGADDHHVEVAADGFHVAFDPLRRRGADGVAHSRTGRVHVGGRHRLNISKAHRLAYDHVAEQEVGEGACGGGGRGW